MTDGDSSEIPEQYCDYVLEIQKSSQRIEAFKAEIIRIKNVKCCPECGRECSFDSVFCAECGAKLSQGDSGDVNHCSCGAAFSDDDIFCFNCGKKIER